MRRHLTFANVAAGLALFFSLAGGAYAAVTIDSGDVANNSLTGKDLKNNSVKAQDVDGLGATITTRVGQTVSGTGFAAATAPCNPGEDLISGGYQASGNQAVFTIRNAPASESGTPTAWQVILVPVAATGATISVTPYALCAS